MYKKARAPLGESVIPYLSLPNSSCPTTNLIGLLNSQSVSQYTTVTDKPRKGPTGSVQLQNGCNVPPSNILPVD
jgi:hypothetical protein